MSYEVLWEPHGVIVTYRGTLSYQCLMDSYIEVNKDSRYNNSKYQVVNTLAVEKVDIKSQDMKLIADLDKGNSHKMPNFRFALVAKNKILERLSNLYNREVNPTTWKLALFFTLDEAVDWAETIEVPVV